MLLQEYYTVGDILSFCSKFQHDEFPTIIVLRQPLVNEIIFPVRVMEEKLDISTLEKKVKHFFPAYYIGHGREDESVFVIET